MSREEGIVRCSACFAILLFCEEDGFEIGSDLHWDEEDFDDDEEVEDEDEEDFLEED
jgi:hypothetical protein